MKQWIKLGYLVVAASLLLLGQSKQSPIEPKPEPQTERSDKNRSNEQNPTGGTSNIQRISLCSSKCSQWITTKTE